MLRGHREVAECHLHLLEVGAGPEVCEDQAVGLLKLLCHEIGDIGGVQSFEDVGAIHNRCD